MKKTDSLYFKILVCVLLSAGLPSAGAANRGENAWELDQKHLELGDIKVSLKTNAVRMDFARYGCVLLAKAPSWKVYIYRPKEKTIWEGSAEVLAPGVIGNPYARPVAVKKLPVLITASGANRDDKGDHQIVEIIGSGKLGPVKYEEYTATIKKKGRRFVFWTTREIDLPERGAQVLCRFYGIPDINMVPLYIRSNNVNTESYSAERAKSKDLPYFPKHLIPQDVRQGPIGTLQTRSVKHLSLNDSTFAEPVGYSKKRDILDVTYSKGAKEELTDLIDSFGYTKEGDEKAAH